MPAARFQACHIRTIRLDEASLRAATRDGKGAGWAVAAPGRADHAVRSNDL